MWQLQISHYYVSVYTVVCSLINYPCTLDTKLMHYVSVIVWISVISCTLLIMYVTMNPLETGSLQALFSKNASSAFIKYTYAFIAEIQFIPISHLFLRNFLKQKIYISMFCTFSETLWSPTWQMSYLEQ